MARATLKCSRCSRTFKMPAHLARHMNSIHGAGAKRKGKVGRPRGSANKRTVPSASGGGSAFGLEAGRFLNDMQAYYDMLTAQRSSLDAEIDSIAAAMSALGTGTRRQPGRPAGAVKTKARVTSVKRGKGAGGTRPGSLKDYIVRVLSQHTKPLSPNDLGSKVIRAGFKTKAKDLTKAISNTLPTMTNIKRVGFGKYQLSR